MIFTYYQLSILYRTRWVALMIQLEQQQHGEFVCGWVGWLTPTTYIQLTGAGSKIHIKSYCLLKYIFDLILQMVIHHVSHNLLFVLLVPI